MDDKKNTEQIQSFLGKAINNKDIPKLYANSFVTAVGQGDLLIVLQQNGVAVSTLNLSYTVAKTLALKMQEAIRELENASGNTIMTSGDVDQLFLSREKEGAQENDTDNPKAE